MVSKQDIERAKSAPLVVVLQALEHVPAKRVGQEWYYISPLRGTERTPSFCVNERTNEWHDHGLADGGDPIKFMQLYAKTDFPDAVRFLLDYTDGGGSMATPQLADSDNRIISLDLSQLTDTALLRFLSHDRGLDLALLNRGPTFKRHLRLATYQRAHRAEVFRSVAWMNDAGGLALRSPGRAGAQFKGNHGPSSFTLVKSAGGSQAKRLFVFEGFMDYLSALVLAKKPAYDDADVLVLNSTRNTKQALDGGSQLVDPYEHVALCLDNDKDGDRYTAIWTAACSHAKVVDWRGKWAGYKDVNDRLCQRPITHDTTPKGPRRQVTPDAQLSAKTARWTLWVKWAPGCARPDPNGEVHETMTYASLSDQYPAKAKLKELMKKHIAGRRICAAQLYERQEDGEPDKLLEQWTDKVK